MREKIKKKERIEEKRREEKNKMMIMMTHRQAMWIVSVHIEIIKKTRRRITATCAHSVRDNGLVLTVYFLNSLCTQL